tara:strand:+ start:112 stop:1605 length:1494 start_codon:yes stop_codon:yes gene_type:complete
MKNNKIKLQPQAAATIDLMRFNGYSIELAIADVIDNSLPVNSKRINVTINFLNGDLANLYVLIEDDGKGMDKGELQNAMDLSAKDLNSKRNAMDLGKFGLGLKSASFSQCKNLLVISKRKNTPISAMQWDLNFVTKNNDWSVNVFDQNKISSIQSQFNIQDTDHGTSILWRECDYILNGLNDDSIQENINNIVSELQKKLSLIYHKYISRGIKIYVNGLELEAMDPFCEKGSEGSRSSKTFEETIHINKEGHKATITGYLLPHISKMGGTKRERNVSINADLMGNQGLYFYRVDRLISWGSWHNLIRKSEANSSARVEISVGNDSDSSWNIEIKKSTINIPYRIRERIKALMTDTAEKSNRVGVRRITRKPLEHALWQRELNKDTQTLTYTINKEHHIIKQYMDQHNIDKEVMYSLLKLIETTTPTDQIQNDLAQRSYDFSYGDEVEKYMIEDAMMFKTLGISFDVYKLTMTDNPSYNLSKDKLEKILITIKKFWDK